MALQAARANAKLTQKQVAQYANISTLAYQRYEYNQREPGVRTAIRIAKALKIMTLKEFYALWEQQTPPDGNQA